MSAMRGNYSPCLRWVMNAVFTMFAACPVYRPERPQSKHTDTAASGHVLPSSDHQTAGGLGTMTHSVIHVLLE
jgi:hypothetical protein